PVAAAFNSGLAQLGIALAVAVACLSAIYPGLLRPLLSAVGTRLFQSSSADSSGSDSNALNPQQPLSRPPPGPNPHLQGRQQHQQPQASLLLAIVLPIYSVAIVCFLIYTLVRFLSVRPTRRQLSMAAAADAAAVANDKAVVYDASLREFRRSGERQFTPISKKMDGPSNEPPLESLERDLQRLVERLDAREPQQQRRHYGDADVGYGIDKNSAAELADRAALRRELAATEVRMMRLLEQIRRGELNASEDDCAS
ncbi:hypothetical protein BOX15_Mlig011656g4, partial [Macrostomum lignano]